MSRALRRTFVVAGRAFECELRGEEGRLHGTVEGAEIAAAARRLGPRRLRLDRDGASVRATVARDGDRLWVCIDGRSFEVQVEEPGGGAAHHAGEEDFATSPMTGTLVKLAVGPGARVEEGGELFVVEAMKMEYVVRAPRTVTVAEVRGEVGGQVDQGHVVVAFAAADEEEA